ncbi:MAG: TlpA family protein disulfide reductase [Candidatus Azotimanducaceae bacterium]
MYSYMKLILIATLFFGPSFFAYSADLGETAPAFSLKSISGPEPVELESQTEKILYIDFWASWCGPCKLSFPSMIKLKELFKDDPFEIIAISVDADSKSAKKFLDSYKINFKVALDSAGVAAEKYALPGMPSSYLLDQDRKVIAKHKGFRKSDFTKIKEEIEEALKRTGS